MAEPRYRFGGPTPEAVKALRARRLRREKAGSTDWASLLLQKSIPVSIPYMLSRPFFFEDDDKAVTPDCRANS